MKKLMLLFALMVTALTGCVDRFGSEISLLERRLALLESTVADFNENLVSLQTIAQAILDDNDFITSIIPVYGSHGEILSYTIRFKKSGTVSLRNGIDGEIPVICLKRGDDGLLYWAMAYGDGESSFITVNNTDIRVSASAVTPQVKIEEGNWYVSYDNGSTWSYIGKATGVSGTAFVSNVITSEDYVTMRFIDGTTVLFPTETLIEKLRGIIATVNDNINALTAIYEASIAKAYAKDIIPISDGTRTIGYRILFSDGTSIPVYNAVQSSMPAISAAADGNGEELYWTIRYDGDSEAQWLLCNGEKVRAGANASIVPIVGVERNGEGVYCWTVSYDNGATSEWILCNGMPVEALVTVPDNPVSAIEEYGSGYYRLVVNGEEMFLPRYRDLGVEISTSVSMGASQTRTLIYYIAQADEKTQILALCQNSGFSVSIVPSNYTRGSLVIESPEDFTSGSTVISLLVSDGEGTLNTTNITVRHE